jgi:TetR/AcrR family transcriptional repressor of nem operon
MGGLGQELSGVNAVFRRKVEACLSGLAERMALCLELAQRTGDIPADADVRQMANLLVDCWEGAALRSRLRRESSPLDAMLDFYFRSAVRG